jgi:peptidoglycan/LPS O-acetylase OafA/YrhL
LLTSTVMGGLPIFGGAILAELFYASVITDFSASKKLINRLVGPFFLLLGWYFMTFPEVNSEWASWSNQLLRIGQHIFPDRANIHNFWCMTGGFFIIFGIILSSTLQRWLSHPWLQWLGHLSFPIYLLHGPLIRSVLDWLLYLFLEPKWVEDRDEDGTVTRVYPRLPIPPLWRFAFAIPLFFAILLFAANEWVKRIEPWCAKVTTKLEERICGPKKEQVAPILLVEGLNEDARLANGRSNGSILPM